MRKKFLFLILLQAIATCTWAYNFKALNADGVMLYYNIISTQNTCELTYGDNQTGTYNGHVTIPATVENNGTTYSVTAIGSNAFNSCNELKAVDVPASVLTIGDDAFIGCTALENLRLDDGTDMLTIGSLQQASRSQFGDSQLKRLYIGRDLSYPTELTTTFSPFSCQSNLEEVVIGNTVTEISGLLLYNSACSGTIVIPGSVTVIKQHAFNTFRGKVDFSQTRNLTSIENYAFMNSQCLSSVTLPEGFTTLGTWVFANCSTITSVDLPSSATTLGVFAFTNCSGISDFYVRATTPPTVGATTFNGCYSATLHVPGSAIDDYKSALFWKNFSNIATLIGRYQADPSGNTIHYAIDAEHHTVEITSIDVTASNLEVPAEVTINGEQYTVTSLEHNTCYIAEGIDAVDVVVKAQVDRLGGSFNGAWLHSLTLPGTITTIGATELGDCSGLEYIEFSEGDDAISYECDADGNSVLSRLPIREAVIGREINENPNGKGMFGGNKSLRKVIIKNVVEIPANMFEDCSALEEVELGASVNTIGNGAFNGTKNMRKVIIRNIVPPTANGDIFGINSGNALDFTTCELWIPARSRELYAKAEPWNKFVVVNTYGLESITLNRRKIIIRIDETETLEAIANPITETLGEVTWTSSDESVATVNEKGEIRGIGAGMAVITAEFDGLSETCEVTIDKKIQEIVWTQDLSDIKIGTSIKLEAEASSKMVVSYEIIKGSEIATIAGDILTVTGAGEIVIAASQAGDNTYSAATVVEKRIYSVSGIDAPAVVEAVEYHVFNLQGVEVLVSTDYSEVLDLPRGIYVVNGEKIIIK